MVDQPKWLEPRSKLIGVPLAKASAQKDVDGSILIRGYFTSDNKDEVGDIITRAATERAVPKYKQWGNIRYMHQPRPVARVTRIGSADGLEWNEVEIKVIDPQAVFEVENGLLNALSVGIFMRFEDVDFLEDGGLVINDYTLAEISLVDHPANYDAFLKGVPVDQGLSMIVREYGLDAVARSMQVILNKESSMETEDAIKDALETAPVVEPEVDTEEVKTELVVPTEEVAPVETPVAETPVEETKTEPVAEIEQPVVEISAEVKAAIDATVVAFTAATKEMLTELQKAIASPTVPQAVAEVPGPTEQAAGDGVEEKDAGLLPTDVTPTEPIAVDRKGALPETTLPEGTAPVEDGAHPTKDLRTAITKYFQSKSR